MKFKELIKSYSFWTTLAGAVVVLVQVLGRIFNFNIPNELVNDLIMAIAGILVALGIVNMPKKSETDNTISDNKEIQEEEKSQIDNKNHKE